MRKVPKMKFLKNLEKFAIKRNVPNKLPEDPNKLRKVPNKLSKFLINYQSS